MTDRPTFVVIAPPPTPNGDLHVGHLSGPYLGADVFSRFQRLQGHDVLGAISTDENQSYVVTSAERLNLDPLELAATNYRDIRATLQQAEIDFDVVGRPDDEYTAFVLDFFKKLHDARAFIEKDAPVYYDPLKKRYLFESYIGGRCPVCFNDTRGNICEVCGHPNDPFTLIRAYPVGQGEKSSLEIKAVKALFLPMENYRARIERYYAENYERLRPTLRALIQTLLRSPLPDFPITYISDWGIRVPVAGYESSVYNVWAEMYPGHLYWVQSGYRDRANGSGLWGKGNRTRYVQFLGFDNSYFYTMAHLALAMAAEDAGIDTVLPSHFITNEFYLLENYKFSTSQRHLIWGKDLLAEYNVDPMRFYLCFSNPETQQANFVVSDMAALLDKHLLRPFERLREDFNTLVERGEFHNGAAPAWDNWIAAFQRRFELAYHPDTFSLRTAAATLASYIDFVAGELRRAVEGASAPEEIAGLGAAVASLALFAAPMMPGFSERLADHFGVYGQLGWGRRMHLPAGQIRAIPAGILSLKRVA